LQLTIAGDKEESKVKNVLFVDDEKLFLRSLSDGLITYAADFNVLTAENGKKAVESLQSSKIDLVVTDLKMPVMDGFELLAYMSTNCADIPVIVMSAFGTPAIESKLAALGVSQFIEKPLDLKELASTILNELTASSEGYIRGITLPTFLQLVEMEKKTCTLRISSGEHSGHLYFRKGELLEAETEELTGEEAAYEIVSWDDAGIEIDPVCRKKTKTIDASLHHVILEGFRIKDEKERRGINTIAGADEDGLFALDSSSQKNITRLEKEYIMALEKHLEGLKEVKGFKAAGVMNFTGEMLASESIDPNIDLALVGATFNDIFRSAHEASKKIGLDACKETIINTPKGVVVMRCSGVDAKVHFHLISIMTADGNQALMKMQIEKMVPAVMQELS